MAQIPTTQHFCIYLGRFLVLGPVYTQRRFQGAKTAGGCRLLWGVQVGW